MSSSGSRGVLGAVKRFFTTTPPNMKSSLHPEEGPEGIRGEKLRPRQPIGQRAIDDPPDHAPVADALKSLRERS
jgi:hypothetical protein